MSAIELRQIDPGNQDAVRNLAVRADQERFVASVDKSLADAYVWSDGRFRAAYHNGKPIGYTLVFPFQDKGRQVVNIVRLMIDARYQGRGFGRELLEVVTSWISAFTPTPNVLRISTLPDNAVALSLYKNAGFVERGLEDDEIALYRNVVR